MTGTEPLCAVSVDDIDSCDDDVDVVVVGGGCAGVCAAIEAADAGARVLLAERTAAIGGTSAMSSGLLYLGGGTATQQACGFTDTVEGMITFLLAACGPGVDEAKVRRYCEQSVAHHDWLVAHDVEFAPSFHAEGDIQPPTDAGLVYTGGEDTWPFADITTPVPRGHHARFPNESGGYLMERLGVALASTGTEVQVNTFAEKLVVDGDRVIGVQLRHDGRTSTVRADGGVILAMGGFLFNPDMVASYVPEAARCTYPLGTDADDGRGIRLATGVGAAVENMDALECHVPFHPPRRLSAGVIVNGQGRRFVNEDAYNGRIGQRALFDHDGVAFLIVDEAGSEPNWLGFRPSWVAETPEELAEEIGVPAYGLAATLARYNIDAERGIDTEFHKRRELVRPLTGPVGAVDLRVETAYYATFTLGGVRTDVDGRALRGDGSVIDGLFAVGRTAAGIPARGYVSGISLGDGTFFGRSAGRAAAATHRNS
ncbi:MAG TPA: FAD-dependent oxidoreductase [Acidimicrobiales bacterium]|nr:FAD-dependent oxidoreductase [Acidimicrobiales bacterium]